MRFDRKTAVFACIFVQCISTAVGATAVSPLDTIALAKKTFIEGKRFDAIEILDRLKAKTKNKKELEELASKRKLFLEQFMTSENYQQFQDARLYFQDEQWTDCLRKLAKITDVDQTNKNFLLLRGKCQKGNLNLDPALKDFLLVQSVDPDDVSAGLELMEIYSAKKNDAQALTLSSKVKPQTSAEVEKYVILKAHALANTAQAKDAIELLRKDHETNIDHSIVLYELAKLYQKQDGGGEWFERKYNSLFVARCKRSTGTKADKVFEKYCAEAQARLLEIENQLSNQPQSQ